MGNFLIIESCEIIIIIYRRIIAGLKRLFAAVEEGGGPSGTDYMAIIQLLEVQQLIGT